MTKLNILIIDYTTHHPEVVATVCRLFSEHCVRLILTSSFLAKFPGQLTPDADIVLVKDKKEKGRAWLARLAPIFAAQDIIIVTTALRDPLLLATLQLETSAKKIAFIHNINYFTEHFPVDKATYSTVTGVPLSSLGAWFRFAMQRWKFIKREAKHRKNGTRFSAFAQAIDYFAFGSEHLAAHFQALTRQNNTVTIPLCNVPQTVLPRPAFTGVLRIAIIGLVSAQRRDYLGVIDALGRVDRARPVELHIIGRCPDKTYASQIKEQIEQQSSANVRIFFDPDGGFVPNDALSQKLASIHLLLNPTRLHFEFHFYQEEYGKSKISGAEGDSIRYNRPTLLPCTYRHSEYVDPFVIGYGGANELGRLIGNLASDESLNALYQGADIQAVEVSIQQSVTELVERCLPPPLFRNTQ